MDSAALWIQIFSPPQFQLVDSLNQPLPTEFAVPVWEYMHKSAESPRLAPIFLYPICRLPHDSIDVESTWPVGTLIVNRDGGFYTLIASEDQGDCTKYGYLRGGLRSRFSRFGSRAMAVTASMAGDGWHIDCFTVNEEVNTEAAALDKHGSFSLRLEEMGLQYDAVYQDPGPMPTLDEETGRMCFLMPDYTPDSRAIVVLDLV
ncbi:hypothetical protein FRC00_004553 [Tulasnella sp. 408]|nr:hypothetical protein FRC00_004553 [Tulasnella sp. 408]